MYHARVWLQLTQSHFRSYYLICWTNIHNKDSASTHQLNSGGHAHVSMSPEYCSKHLPCPAFLWASSDSI